MIDLRRLGHLFLAGFVVSAGASMALAAAVLTFEKLVRDPQNQHGKPHPSSYQSPPSTDLKVSGLTVSEITRNGGVRGTIENRTERRVDFVKAELGFYKTGQRLFGCTETIRIDLDPGKSTQFFVLCKEVERSALSPEIMPSLTLLGAYLGRGT